MNIDWPILAAASGAIGLSYIFLVRIVLLKNRELDRLASSLRRTESELLQTRTEYAKEIAELRDEHTKRTTALQGNVRDLTTLAKKHGASGWESWAEKGRR